MSNAGPRKITEEERKAIYKFSAGTSRASGETATYRQSARR
jgi:hypothetical protein